MKYIACAWIAWAWMTPGLTTNYFSWIAIAEYGTLNDCNAGIEKLKSHKGYLCMPNGMYPEGYRLNLGGN